MKRIEKLRSIALNAVPSKDAFDFAFFKHYHENGGNEFERYGKSFFDAYCELRPIIREDELIVGEYTPFASFEDERLWNEAYKDIKDHYQEHTIYGMSGHMAVDYEILLSKGLRGMIELVDSCLATCETEKVAFYKACRVSLEAVIRHSENYSMEAGRQARETHDPKRRAELESIAALCKKVPAQPAESFYEALQSVYFLTYCITQNPFYGIEQFVLGHPDRYLLPYYTRDLASGAITKEFAGLLLDCLGIKLNMLIPKGWVSGYMVGGRDENGAVVANELTELCMQVIDDIRLVQPSVGLCYTRDMPEKYLEKACEILSHGRSHPAIFNDDVITKGLISYGVPEPMARNYIHSACVEITPVGASNVWVASPYTNMPQLLLDALDENHRSFESVVSSVFSRLDEKIKKDFDYFEDLRKDRARHSMFPLQSCFVHDCLERGVDIERGGAIFNWTMPSFVGIANLTDSLYALKTLVFDEKEMTLSELKQMLDSNYEGKESVRLEILNRIPKYGNDDDEVDGIFGRITEHIIAECQKHRGFLPESQLIPSSFCYTWHTRFGKVTNATPDGRLKGFPLGDGAGPCQGREKNGPTASIISSTKWDHHRLIGGVAVNVKFSKENLGSRSLETMKSLIKTYMMRGGFEMQINVVDRGLLEKARDNHEEYRDLIVRIGGYSDYFTRLSPEMQEEVISRTEHKI